MALPHGSAKRWVWNLRHYFSRRIFLQKTLWASLKSNCWTVCGYFWLLDIFISIFVMTKNRTYSWIFYLESNHSIAWSQNHTRWEHIYSNTHVKYSIFIYYIFFRLYQKWHDVLIEFKFNLYMSLTKKLILD